MWNWFYCVTSFNAGGINDNNIIINTRYELPLDLFLGPLFSPLLINQPPSCLWTLAGSPFGTRTAQRSHCFNVNRMLLVFFSSTSWRLRALSSAVSASAHPLARPQPANPGTRQILKTDQHSRPSSWHADAAALFMKLWFLFGFTLISTVDLTIKQKSTGFHSSIKKQICFFLKSKFRLNIFQVCRKTQTKLLSSYRNFISSSQANRVQFIVLS